MALHSTNKQYYLLQMPLQGQGKAQSIVMI